MNILVLGEPYYPDVIEMEIGGHALKFRNVNKLLYPNK